MARLRQVRKPGVEGTLQADLGFLYVASRWVSLSGYIRIRIIEGSDRVGGNARLDGMLSLR